MAECIRICSNGDWRRSNWEGENLQQWLEYNKTFRVGQAIVVDGKIEALGDLTEAQVKKRIEEIQKLPSYTGRSFLMPKICDA